jgi:hypothetical protein
MMPIFNMEKDLGRIKKNNETDIVVRVDDFGGKLGLTIREFTSSERYSGFTKSGTRIPLESMEDFKKMISSLDVEDLKKQATSLPNPEQKNSTKDDDIDESSYL